MTTTLATAATLTLPIVIGNRYVRRDGEVIIASAHEGGRYAWTCEGKSAVWLDTGRIYEHPAKHSPHDLVADYIEEPCVEDVVDDLRQPVDSRTWRVAPSVYGHPSDLEVDVVLHALGSSLVLSRRAAREMARKLLEVADKAEDIQARIGKSPASS